MSILSHGLLGEIGGEASKWRVEEFSGGERDARAGLAGFLEPELVVKFLEDALHWQYENTNHAASEGTNPHLKILARGNFRVATPALEDVERVPVPDILPRQHLVPLSEVLGTVDHHCGMLIRPLAADPRSSGTGASDHNRRHHEPRLRDRCPEDGAYLPRNHRARARAYGQLALLPRQYHRCQ